MVQPPTSASHYTQHFLNTILSSRGPSSPPYTEDVKWLIRQHLLSLIDTFPSLTTTSALFTHNDGRTVNLLQVNGTIPMTYNQVTYNIPIIIWLMESYPRHPPLVFVNPTTDMIIKRPHSFVSPSGAVSIPYLQNWVYPSSNLVELGRNLGHFFGREPPLYSQRRLNPNPNTNNANYSSGLSSSNYSGNTNNYGSDNSVVNSGNEVVRPAIPPRPYPPSPYGVGSGGGGGKYVDDQVEVFRRNAVNKLVESLYSDIGSMRKAREGEMEGLFNAQGVLRQREGELLRGVKEMQDEKEGLEQQLQMELMNADVLEGWLRENEQRVEVLKDVDVDDVFEHSDVLSKQISECTASDLAIEDAIYALDKAVQEGVVPFDQYLRNVRLLSRQQFIHRATASKVRDAQMRTQVSYMASRAPGYSM
ncbi:hypothetical protein Leryth_012216 [Lithospermum erythrorhizon]|nr:hypothetical protein Leryth_012216 [Lithospermum erythrorhizon]